MSKPVKSMMIESLRSAYANVQSACIVDLTGMDAIALHQFRSELRKRRMGLRVMRNRLAMQAFKETPLAPLRGGLTGPSALVVGGDSVVDVAKALVEWTKKYPALKLKDGLIDGDTSLIPVPALAKLKSLAETRGLVAGAVLSPGGKIAGCLRGPAGRIAGCVKAIADKQGGGEAAA